MNALFAIAAFGAFYCVWTFITFTLFCAVTMLRMRHDSLPPFALRVGYIVYGIGLFFDVGLNFMSNFTFFNCQREFLFTGRVRRLKRDAGWAGSMARWFRPILDAIDPGHCE